jgi:dihydroneopterin aldolase|tara:strand:+ start:7561 stop:7920 length:360 start_codon:yes stop_codon:yes gene_type:complete
MIKIGLSNIETRGHHGVFKEEQEKGNLFFTDVDVWFKSRKSVTTDNLEDTFDYQFIHDAVKAEMAKPSKLLEHLAGRIIKTLSETDKRIKKVKVKIAKMNPPIDGKAERSIIELKERVN